MIAHHLYLVAPGASPADIRRFYVDALELTEVQTPESLAQTPVLWFDAGTILFHVGYPDNGTVGSGHTALAVSDVAAARAHFIGLGYAADDNVIPMGYSRFYVHDPWGNSFEILPSVLP